MPRDTITSKTGNASVMKQGHTTSGKHGTDPNAKVRGGNSVRELKIK